jgi:transposase
VIVIGIDPHMRSHTACAINGVTGELQAELTVNATREGHQRLLAWARRLASERTFCLEDCRHVSSNLERLLLARGEEVVRVPPHIAAGLRRRGRRRGKSDSVDALAVARAYLQEPDLPRAQLAGSDRELRLLVDHRDDLVAERRRIQQRLRWHLHELECDLLPGRALGRAKWLDREPVRVMAHRRRPSARPPRQQRPEGGLRPRVAPDATGCAAPPLASARAQSAKLSPGCEDRSSPETEVSTRSLLKSSAASVKLSV